MGLPRLLFHWLHWPISRLSLRGPSSRSLLSSDWSLYFSLHLFWLYLIRVWRHVYSVTLVTLWLEVSLSSSLRIGIQWSFWAVSCHLRRSTTQLQIVSFWLSLRIYVSGIISWWVVTLRCSLIMQASLISRLCFMSIRGRFIDWSLFQSLALTFVISPLQRW